MATLQDTQLGLAIESTYGTGVTATRFFEIVDENLTYKKNVVQGNGLRVGSRVARSGRRVVTRSEVGGDINVEVVSKGFGLLWQLCFGTAASTLVSGSTFQQLFTPTQTATTLPAATVQKGNVQIDGTARPATYKGMTVDSWEFTLDTGGLAMLKVTFDGQALDTATALATASYPSAPNLLNFSNVAASGMTIGGAVTVPTTTALASGGTAVANVRSFSLSCNNNVAGDRYNLGASGLKAQPTVGLRTIKGKVKVEFTDVAIRDAFLNETAVPITLTLTGGALSTGSETLQFVIPEAKLNGDMPDSNATDIITIDADFDVLDNLTAAQPLYLAVRTADAAL